MKYPGGPKRQEKMDAHKRSEYARRAARIRWAREKAKRGN